MKTYKQQLVNAKAKRVGIVEQKTLAQQSCFKRRAIKLRVLMPPMLGWTDFRWQSVGTYIDREAAQIRAHEFAARDVSYQQAKCWSIDGEPFTPNMQSDAQTC